MEEDKVIENKVEDVKKEEKKIFKISGEALNLIFGYLGRKPYVEVANLLKQIQEDIQLNTKKEDN